MSIVILTIVHIFDLVLCHQKSKRVMLGHHDELVICGHWWVSTANELVMLEVNPAWNRLSPSHFSVHENSSMVPKRHPLKHVLFISVRSYELVSFLCSVDAYFLKFLGDKRYLLIHFVIIVNNEFSVVRHELLIVRPEPAWLWRCKHHNSVGNAFLRQYILLNHAFNQLIRNTAPVNSALFRRLVEVNIFLEDPGQFIPVFSVPWDWFIC